jgi:chemotaxis protein MotB
VKKKHPEHVNLERWLVSYADFITLLFAFFVVMYSTAESDKAKFKHVAASLRAAFNGGWIDTGSTGQGRAVTPFEPIEPPGGRALDLPAGRVNTMPERDPELEEIRELMEETVSLDLGATDVSEKVQMRYDSRGLIVRIAVKDFFAPQAVIPHRDLWPMLDRIATVLRKTRRHIRIEGHSDLSESKPIGFKSDWELSAARAAWVAQYWIQKFDFDPNHLGVAGYSHFQPLSIKKDHLSQAKNRRIEIIILNQLYENP